MARTKIKQKTWTDYDIGDPSKASYEELKAAVRRAAKAANQRLLRLERAGATTGVYQSAMEDLGNMRMQDGRPAGGRRRFQENPGKFTINQLRHEYRALRSFLSAKTSTVQGRRESEDKRYQTARERGYMGTADQFNADIARAFTELNESLFSSEQIYESAVGGNLDVLDEIIDQQKKPSKGRSIIEYMKRTKARARPK